VVVYEARREAEDRASMPRGAVSDAVDATLELWGELRDDEDRRGLALTREVDTGFVWPMYRWARGESLAKVLASAHGVEGDMPAGDFVRWARQVVDLLGQIADTGTGHAGGRGETGPLRQGTRQTARTAMAAVSRGVLAYSSIG
jgi:ATP-dependent RNA helicase HelY